MGVAHWVYGGLDKVRYSIYALRSEVMDICSEVEHGNSPVNVWFGMLQ